MQTTIQKTKTSNTVELTEAQIANIAELRRIRKQWKMMCASESRPTASDHLQFTILQAMLNPNYDYMYDMDTTMLHEDVASAFTPVTNKVKLENGRYHYDTVVQTAFMLASRLKNNSENVFSMSEEVVLELRDVLLEVTAECIDY